MRIERLVGLGTLTVCLGLISGCASDGEYVRGTYTTGKSDRAGSCEVSSCGGVSPDGCGCDDTCAIWNDCCEDYGSVCEVEDTNVYVRSGDEI